MSNHPIQHPSLDGAYRQWLEASHPRYPDITNADRGKNDLLNYRRALECFAAGVSGGISGPDKIDVEALDIRDLLLARHVEEGARILAAHSRRKEPSRKTTQNLISYCRAIQKEVLGDKGHRASASSHRAKPKARMRPAFPHSEWPDAFRKDWKEFLAWKSKPVLTEGEGSRYRKTACRPVSVNAQTDRINQVLRWFVRELGRDEVALEDLACPDNYLQFLNWYLEQNLTRGHVHAHSVGVTLAGLSQFLVARGRIPELTASGKPIWNVFYEHSEEPLRIAAKQGLLKEPDDVGNWKPWHLRELGLEGWNTDPMRRQRGNEGRWQNQKMVRKRSALFFLLAHETPLRARNFLEMRWGHNLIKLPDGRWQVAFRGPELKVGHRNFRTNVYQRIYTDETSRIIDTWRELLAVHAGPNLQELDPHVFPGFVHRKNNRGNPLGHNSFSLSVSKLCEELRGEPFNPHKARHIIGSYFVNEHGSGGLGIAAELLGDKPETVLRAYYRPNNEQAFQAYLDSLA